MVSRSVQVSSPRKQRTFRDTTTRFTSKWRLRNERRNSILMTNHFLDLGSVSDWSCRVRNFLQPIRSTTQIWKKSQEIVLLHVTSYKLLNFRINDFSWVTSLRLVGRLPSTANGRYQTLETKLSGLWARSLVTFQQVLILKFALEPENLLVLSRNGSQVSAWLWNFQAGDVKQAENGVKAQEKSAFLVVHSNVVSWQIILLVVGLGKKHLCYAILHGMQHVD